MKLTEWLEAHPRVQKVNYPGLKANAGHDLHFKQATGAGSIFSFITGDIEFSKIVVEETKLHKITVSFGGTTSLISLPCFMSHASIPPKFAPREVYRRSRSHLVRHRGRRRLVGRLATRLRRGRNDAAPSDADAASDIRVQRVQSIIFKFIVSITSLCTVTGVPRASSVVTTSDIGTEPTPRASRRTSPAHGDARTYTRSGARPREHAKEEQTNARDERPVDLDDARERWERGT